MNTTAHSMLKLTRFSKPWNAEGNCCHRLGCDAAQFGRNALCKSITVRCLALPRVKSMTAATFANQLCTTGTGTGTGTPECLPSWFHPPRCAVLVTVPLHIFPVPLCSLDFLGIKYWSAFIGDDRMERGFQPLRKQSLLRWHRIRVWGEGCREGNSGGDTEKTAVS